MHRAEVVALREVRVRHAPWIELIHVALDEIEVRVDAGVVRLPGAGDDVLSPRVDSCEILDPVDLE